MKDILSPELGILVVFISILIVGMIQMKETKTVTYYPYAVVYEKGEQLNISTFTTNKPVSVTMGSGVLKVDGVELDKTKGATKILNVEALTPIISKE